VVATTLTSLLAPVCRGADTSLGEVVDLPSIAGAFPEGIVPIDHGLSADRFLFVAEEKSVLVWTPWGWERIWTVRKDPKFEKIKAIACTRGKSGERLLIATTHSIAAVSWGSQGQTTTRWGKAERTFRTEPVAKWPKGEEPSALVVNPYPARADGEVLAYVADGANRLYAVRDPGELQVEAVRPGPVGGSVEFSPSGHALAWPYRGKVVSVLSPTGRVVGQVDAGQVMAGDAVEEKNLQVQCARIDESRGLWFVATSHGLAVVQLNQKSKQLEFPLHRVKRLGTVSVLTIGSFLGRVLLVTDGDEKGRPGVSSWRTGSALGGTTSKRSPRASPSPRRP
jgi:hypothetical protein